MKSVKEMPLRNERERCIESKDADERKKRNEMQNEVDARWSERRNEAEEGLWKERGEEVEKRTNTGSGSSSGWFAERKEEKYISVPIQMTILIQVSANFLKLYLIILLPRFYYPDKFYICYV